MNPQIPGSHEVADYINDPNNKTTIEWIDLLLRYIPYHGPFDAVLMDTFYLPKSDQNPIRLIMRQHDGMLARVILYLVHFGYANYRDDMKYENRFYIEMTERGRWLKEKGSMAEYRQYQDRKKEAEKNAQLDRAREVQRSGNSYRLTWSIAVATGVAGIYYTLEIIRIHFPEWLSLSVFFLLLFVGGVIGGSLQYLLQLIDRIVKKYRNK